MPLVLNLADSLHAEAQQREASAERSRLNNGWTSGQEALCPCPPSTPSTVCGMPLKTDGPAPYAPPATVLHVLQRYRDHGLLTPITLDVLQRIAIFTSLAPRTLQTLKLLDLLDEEGQPTEALVALKKAPTEDDAKARFAESPRDTYAEVFNFVDPAKDTAEHVEGAFRAYVPEGQRGRMVTLFLGLCAHAGLIQNHPKRSKMRNAGSRSAGAGAVQRSRSAAKAGSSGANSSESSPTRSDPTRRRTAPLRPMTSSWSRSGNACLLPARLGRPPIRRTGWPSRRPPSRFHGGSDPH
jgi:hypothetical protein